MRSLKIFLLFYFVYSVNGKGNLKSLTESLGQEVIEIGTPIKELPPDLDEEPSAEADDDDDNITSTTLQPATKKETKRTTVNSVRSTPEGRRKVKDIDKIDSPRDDEDARIEKELAEIYKDNLDYKADSAEVKEVVNNTVEDKPIVRSRVNFKFQPDGTNKADVERWRTSVDEITCDKSVTKKLVHPDSAKSACRLTVNLMVFGLLSAVVEL